MDDDDLHKAVIQIQATQAALISRLDKVESLVNERNDEMHAMLRDLAITTSHFSEFKSEIKALRAEHDQLETEIKQAMTVFQAGRWFLTAVIPMLVGILLMQIFKLDGMPWGS